MDSSQAPGEWKQFIFFCWETPLSCVIGCCFPCILTCSNARHLEKQGAVYTCLSCCETPLANYLLRDQARKKYGIKGSDLEDLVRALILVYVIRSHIDIIAGSLRLLPYVRRLPDCSRD